VSVNAWIVVAEQPAIGNLITVARNLGGPAGQAELGAVVAGAVRHIGDVDLVVTGDSSVDVAAKMVPTVLAGELGWPALAEVTTVTGQAGALRVTRAIPGGTQVLEISGPVVLATSADATTPRVPGMKDLLAAGKKPVEHVDLAALDVPARSAVMTVAGRARPARKQRKNQILDTTDPAAAAAELVKALREVGAL
jgi:electron transfer flavoprotein beta subunit